MKLPKTIYANRTAAGLLYAAAKPGELFDDDGPLLVGTYRLVQARKLAKETVEVKPATRARRK
jgi:hypothetical protein